ncbi:hypothetical protein PXK01_16680 [Phaeobacter sp. PT47_59]|nr:hypothetical protein [Phaeobacter sp. PT47_59]MDE4175800.1 hypothetical protein [Phaeobacter sp. PT47_59]
MSTEPLPQTGGSFIRKPDGGLEQVEKPAADPKPAAAPKTTKPSRKGKEA